MLRNSSKERIICYSLIFVLLSALIYFIFIGNEEYVEDYNIKIEALEAKVDSLHNINDDLVFKIDTLNKEIINQDKKIVTLKVKVNEKVNSVDNFNDDELYQFFADRYRQHLDSIGKANSKASN
jgi:cell division protein FtsB